MQFKSPEFLWFLFLIPLFIVGYILILRRRNQYALRYASLSLVKEALGKGPGKRRHIPPAFFLLGLMLMFIAAARPYGTLTLVKQQATVILAIDVSRSMRANDLQPNRLEAAKAAARAFIELQDANVRIGIVSFSGNAALVQAPTNDREALLAAINRLTLQNSTAIGSGILASLDAIFEKPGNPASPAPQQDDVLGAPTPTPTPVAPGVHIPSTIILLTDGQNRTGPLPVDAARVARDRGVRVYTIRVGTTQGGSVPPPDRGFSGGGFGGGVFGGGPGGGGGFRTVLDEETLKRIAALTEGQYYHASDSESLLAIYQQLDKELITTKEEEEVAVFFTAGAVVCLLIGGVLSMLWFSRLP